ncbi:MAG: hypothetical protein LUQ02_03290 [Methanothrix sp.]|nr:hypothetical protein [Methanothrix sp.]
MKNFINLNINYLAGEIMKFKRIPLVLLCLALFAICIFPACSAYEGSISVIGNRNISFDLISEPDYAVSNNASVAKSMQVINVSSTKPDGKNASITIMSMNMFTFGSQILNQSEFSGFMENMFIGAMKLANGRELESLVVRSPTGKNVTLHRIVMPSGINQPANESISAFWDLDEYNHVILSSEMDLNATSKIVETLEIIP